MPSHMSKAFTSLVYDKITIVGDAMFIDQVKRALDLIRGQAPDEYEEIVTYLKRIEWSTRSGMAAYEDPPTFYLANATAFASITWCAGSIAHDAYHSKLYHEFLVTNGNLSVPDYIWTGKGPEMKCIEFQLIVMNKIDAPKNERDYLASQDGMHFDCDANGIYDWRDYQRQNW